MTLYGKLSVTLQGRITFLSDVDVGQSRRARCRGHQGRERGRKVGQSIRVKVIFAFSMNDGDTREEIGQESSPSK